MKKGKVREREQINDIVAEAKSKVGIQNSKKNNPFTKLTESNKWKRRMKQFSG